MDKCIKCGKRRVFGTFKSGKCNDCYNIRSTKLDSYNTDFQSTWNLLYNSANTVDEGKSHNNHCHNNCNNHTSNHDNHSHPSYDHSSSHLSYDSYSSESSSDCGSSGCD